MTDHGQERQREGEKERERGREREREREREKFTTFGLIVFCFDRFLNVKVFCFGLKTLNMP